MSEPLKLEHPGGEQFKQLKYPPTGWHFVQQWGDGHAFRHMGMYLLIDCDVKEDGRKWLHISVSKNDWVPSHADMAKVKDAFVGNGRYAYAVFPPTEMYVNLHPYCLHLWALAEGPDGKVLPEFSGQLDGIGRSI